MDSMYERIESLCQKRGVTVTAVCRDCGLLRSTLSDYKNGRIKSLSASVLKTLADYFAVSVDYLISGGEESPEAALKVALFGGNADVTEEMWDEVKRYAQYIKERQHENRTTL